MNNVVEFRRPAAAVTPPPPVAPAESQPMVEPLANTIAHAPAGEVAAALLFYARNGWDGGAKAMRALMALEQVLRPQELPPSAA